VVVLRAGQRIVLSKETYLDVVYPLPGDLGGNPNNNSVVLRLVCGTQSMLLTGDIEREAEREMLSTFLDLKSDVLKVAHHGSRTSSTPEFLRRVDPESAVIPVGKWNKYRHPAPDVIRRYKALGIPLFRTDDQGAVIFKFFEAGRSVETVVR